jgi:outer membrane protein OmpA-like peptidoglycan-associated protein
MGLGEADPLVSPETTEADRAANRRVVVVPQSSGA